MLIVFHRGRCSAQYANTSVTRRIDGRGGKMYVPRAMYSFRMSFWVVPPIRSLGTPWRRATATYLASRLAAGAVVVLDGGTRSGGRVFGRKAESSVREMETPTAPTSPTAARAA